MNKTTFKRGKDAWLKGWREEAARLKAEDKAKRETGWVPVGERLVTTGGKISDLGNSLTRRVTFPIILFILGAITFPIGILFWLIGLWIMTSGKKK